MQTARSLLPLPGTMTRQSSGIVQPPYYRTSDCTPCRHGSSRLQHRQERLISRNYRGTSEGSVTGGRESGRLRCHALLGCHRRRETYWGHLCSRCGVPAHLMSRFFEPVWRGDSGSAGAEDQVKGWACQTAAFGRANRRGALAGWHGASGRRSASNTKTTASHALRLGGTIGSAISIGSRHLHFPALPFGTAPPAWAMFPSSLFTGGGLLPTQSLTPYQPVSSGDSTVWDCKSIPE
jgi:hypothetical protein